LKYITYSFIKTNEQINFAFFILLETDILLGDLGTSTTTGSSSFSNPSSTTTIGAGSLLVSASESATASSNV